MKANLLLVFFMLIFFAACNSQRKNEKSEKIKSSEEISHTTTEESHHGHDHGHDHADHDHSHIFVCPVHAEVEQEEPGNCPKCGAELEFLEDESKPRYTVDFKLEPADPEPGKPVKILLKPYNVNAPKEKVEIRNLHGRQMHLVIINKDFSYFRHVFPQEKDGNFSTEILFPEAGKYVLYPQFLAKNFSLKIGQQEIIVKGNQVKTENSKLQKESRTWQKNGYKVELKTGKPFEFNIATNLVLNISKNGKDITDITETNGVLGYLTIISEDKKKFLFVQQLTSETMGPNIHFHTMFPTKGFYKVFAEFKHNNENIVADFVLEVKE